MDEATFRLLVRAAAEFGTVYLLRDDRSGRVKIGHSVDLWKRIGDLRTGSSGPLRLVGVIIGTRDIEAGLHAEFADRRVQGEWFDDHDGHVTEVFIDLAGSLLGKGKSWDTK